MQKWTALPAEVALQCPAWASDEAKRLADDAAKMFATTRAARAEVERLKAEAGTIDLMVTTLDDLVGAGSAARRGMIESLRCELVARSKFSEFVTALEADRKRTETEALERIDQARADAKQQLIDAGCRDLSEAVNHRGKPDEDLRAAFNQVVNSFPSVGRAADTYSAARSMTAVLMERSSHNARNRSEAEKELRGLLERMASVAVG